MTTSATSERKQNMAICTVCLDWFKEPMILPCLHTFCKGCITEGSNSSTFMKIKCPLCDEKFEANSIKSNVYTKRLTELTRSKSSKREMCVVCNLRQRRTRAYFRCLDCSECLCPGCAEAHLLTKLFANHQIINCQTLAECPIQMQRQNLPLEAKVSSRQACSFRNRDDPPEASFPNFIHTVERNTELCSHHMEEILEYFCNKCALPICYNCVVDEHRVHEFIKLSSAVEQKMTELQRLLTALERKERQVNGVLAQSRLQTGNSDLVRTDNTDYTNSLVETENQESRKEMNHTFEETKKVDTSRIKELEYQWRASKNCIKFCNDILKNGAEVEIMSLEKLLTDRLHFLLSLDSSSETLALKNLKPLTSIENVKLDNHKIEPFSFAHRHYTTKSTCLKDSDTADKNDRRTRDVHTQTEDNLIRNSKQDDKSVDENDLKIDLFAFEGSDDSVFGNERSRKSTPSPIFSSNNGEHCISACSAKDMKTSFLVGMPTPGLDIISDEASIVLKLSGSGNEKSRITIHSENDIRPPSLVGMAMYDHESLILADSTNRVLKVISLDGVCRLEYSLNEIVPQHITVCGNIIAVSGLSKILFMSKDETWKEMLHVENSRGYYPLTSHDNKDVIVGNFSADSSFPITLFSQTSDPRHIFLKDALPSYLVCSNQGQLFVSDLCSHSIRVLDIVRRRELKRISMTREIDAHTLKDKITHLPPVWHPGSLAVDISGNLFVLDKEGKTVVSLDNNAQFVKDTVIDLGTISRPKYLTCDDNGYLYILGNHGNVLHYFKTSMFL